MSEEKKNKDNKKFNVYDGLNVLGKGAKKIGGYVLVAVGSVALTVLTGKIVKK